MSFQPRNNRPAPPRPRPRSAPTIAVGQRVFVHCPNSRSGTVELVDDTGKVLSAIHLADGAEVEVVAWRPRVEGDAHYRIRASSSGVDGWLPSGNLRKVLVPVAATEMQPSNPNANSSNSDRDDGATGFGRRAHAMPTTSMPSPSPMAARPMADADTGGRRFGSYQHAEPARGPAAPAPNTKQEPYSDDTGGRRFGRNN